MRTGLLRLCLFWAGSSIQFTWGADCPQWGGDDTRNIGTNNGSPREHRFQGDRSVLMCFDEATGKFLWQLVVSKLRHAGNFNGDYAHLGICSTPTVKGDQVYLVTGRCEALCLDVHGLANGDEGPFKDEGEYIAAPVCLKAGKQPTGGYPADAPRGPYAPLELLPTDADIIWRYTGINRSFSTPSVIDGLVFVADARGVVHCLNVETGQCYWTHETRGQMVGSTLAADGRVYAGNGEGRLTVLAASREKKVLGESRVGSAIHATPVAANGVLYIATQRYLYAVQQSGSE